MLEKKPPKRLQNDVFRGHAHNLVKVSGDYYRLLGLQITMYTTCLLNTHDEYWMPHVWQVLQQVVKTMVLGMPFEHDWQY